MASADPWADFESLRHNVKYNTVDRLKHILSLLNEQCGTNFTKSGKKQELIERITRELDEWKRTGQTEKWAKAKAILSQSRGGLGPAMPTYRTSTYSSVYHQNPHSNTSTSMYQIRPPVDSNNIPHYDPYATVRKPAMPSSSSSTSISSPTIHFKHSPFFRVEKMLSGIVECPESTSQMDRKSQTLTFQITADVLSKLQSTSPKYQLRLYCTSSTYYSNSGFRQNVLPCPIEFPPTCEVRVNSIQLNANLKGMKKKPGTAPPPDLGKNVRLTPGASNRIEMVYVNSQQPTLSKKYYMVVMLVEVTTVEQLIDRLRKGKYRSGSEILAKMQQSANEDDDIIAGSQKLSLKCPLSYMRITTPCRSSTCVHSQCFDAYSWYSVMEQTTTWLCPVCEKVLNTEELFVDGYFDDILKATDEEVEDVIVEADGQWHTTDNTYASAAWKAAHPVKQESLPPTPVKQRSPTPTKPVINGSGAHAKAAPNNAEIVVLDSDDEDEGQVKRELSPTAHRSVNTSWASIPGQPPRSQTADSEVIDLTLDSDDDEPPIRTQLQSQSRSQPLTQSRSQPPLNMATRPTQSKRKTDEREIVSPTEQIWKKSRLDAPSSHSSSPVASTSTASPVPYVNGANGTNGAAYSSPRDLTRTLPPPSPNRFANSYPSRQPYNGPYIPPGSAPISARPPLPNLHTGSYSTPYVGSRSNGTGSSSQPSTWRA